MGVHVVKNGPRPWGSVIAQGLGQTLSHLAEAKIQKMKTNEDIKLLQSLGVDPLSARFINSLPNDQKREAVGNYLNKQSQQQEQQQQQQQEESPMQQVLAPQPQFQQQQQPVQQSQERPGLGNLFNNGTIGSGINPEFLSRASQAPQKQQQQRQIAAQEQQQIAQQAQQQQAQQQTPAVQQPTGPVAVSPKSKGSLLGEALKPTTTPAQELALRKESRAERVERANAEKELKKAEDKSNAATKTYYEEVVNAEKAAKESDNDLKKMKRLIEKGSLPEAKWYKILKDAEESLSSFGGVAKNLGAGAALGFAAGGPVGAALGAGAGVAVSPVATMGLYAIRNKYPDTEEFEKLSNGFIRYAKPIFGARLTDADLKAFLSTVPTLANTEHGKKAIIHNMDLFNKAVHAKYDVMREIIKENGGNRPLDLAVLVQDRLETRLDQLAQEWEKSAEGEEATAVLRQV